MKFVQIPALALTLSSLQPAYADAYICVDEQNTGFVYEGGKWEVARFNLGKWLVNTEEGGKVTKFGQDYSSFSGEDCPSMSNLIFCMSGHGHFRMSSETMRFSRSYTHGYTDGAENNDNTPVLTIGTCAKM